MTVVIIYLFGSLFLSCAHTLNKPNFYLCKSNKSLTWIGRVGWGRLEGEGSQDPRAALHFIPSIISSIEKSLTVYIWKVLKYCIIISPYIGSHYWKRLPAPAAQHDSIAASIDDATDDSTPGSCKCRRFYTRQRRLTKARFYSCITGAVQRSLREGFFCFLCPTERGRAGR